jgi:hypothetical protein
MARLAPLWQQNGTYPANTDRVLLGTLWPGGGSSGAAPSLVAGTMNVSVAAGTAAVPLGTSYSALCRWDAAEVVPLAAAPPSGQSRIDLIVAQVRDQVIDAGSNNDFVFLAVTGTPAASNPAAPAVPANAYAVCAVTVPGAAVNLNGATLTDRRAALVTVPSTVKTRVYRAAAWVDAANNATPYDTVAYGAGYSTAANAYVCPQPGDYLIIASVGLTANVANMAFQAQIAKNGAVVVSGQQSIQPTNGFGFSCLVSEIVPATTGDQLAILTAGYAGNSTGLTGSGVTFLTVRLLP